MQVELRLATLRDKSKLRQLLELYSYDFSEWSQDDVDENGFFGYGYLDAYWMEPDRQPFLIRVDGRLAGLALVRTATYYLDGRESICIAEFFVMRKYRRRSVGTQAAKLLFDGFTVTGKWPRRPKTRPRRRSGRP